MRINSLFIIVASVLTLFLQLTLLRFAEIASIKPELLFIWVIMSSFYLPLRSAVFTNWLIGIMADATSNSSLGTMGFLYLLVGLAISLLREMFFREDIAARVGITFISVYFCHFLYGAGMCFARGSLDFWFIIIKPFGIAVYTTIAGIAFFFVLAIIERVVQVKRLRDELKP
ncbi:MAG: rod shape-determining protein MreD [Planctomycetes bacterium]|nr:rod shape-determining protein MreD [Planctomycetota bacterium]